MMNARAAMMSAVVVALLAHGACTGANQLKVLETPSLTADDRTVTYQHGGVLMALKSGMRLLVLPGERTNMVKIDVRYLVGSRADPQGRSGLAHLVEHLTFAAKPQGSSRTIGEQIGDLVLYNNAYTEWDATQYTATASGDHLDELMALEAQRMQVRCAHIDEALFAREREVVRNELRERSNTSARLQQLFLRDVYGDTHPYGKSIGGSDVELAAITRDDVCAFLTSHYQPGNVIMVLSGDVTLEEAKRLFGRLYSKIPGKPVERAAAVPAPTLRGTVSEHTLPVTEATALIAYNAPAFTSDKSAYERIARHLLAERLVKVNQENKAIIDIRFIETGGRQAPLFVIEVSVNDPARLRAVVTEIQSSTTGILRRVDDDGLGHIKERVRTKFLRSIESFAREAELFLDYLHHSDHQEYALAELRQYDRMSRGQLDTYLETRYRANQSHVVYIMPGSDNAPATRRAALSFSPTDYELSDWRTSVDIGEAERTLPLSGQPLRPQSRSFELENGLKVVLVPALGHPVVDMRLLFRGGTLHAPAGNPELAKWAAELLEHDPMVKFRASVDPALALQLLRAIHRMGGTLDNRVDETTTTFRSTGLSMYADGLLWQLYWLAYTGYYDPKTLTAYREQARRSRDQSTDARRQRELLLGAVYGDGHPYARQRSEREQLESLSIDDLNRFRDAHCHAGNATLIITGEFDEKLLVPQIRRLFGSLKSRASSKPRSMEPPASSNQPTYIRFVDERAAQLTITMAFSTSATETHKLAERLVLLELLKLELDGLRERLGASYGVRVEHIRRAGPGLLLIDADVDSQRAVESYREFLAALERVRAGDVLPSFVRARRAVLRELLASSVDSATVADELELAFSHGLSQDFHADLARQVARMRFADLREVIAVDLAKAGSVTMLSGHGATIDAVYGSVGVSAHALR